MAIVFFVQAEDGIRDLVRSRGLGDVYKRQVQRIDDAADYRGLQGCEKRSLVLEGKFGSQLARIALQFNERTPGVGGDGRLGTGKTWPFHSRAAPFLWGVHGSIHQLRREDIRR